MNSAKKMPFIVNFFTFIGVFMTLFLLLHGCIRDSTIKSLNPVGESLTNFKKLHNHCPKDFTEVITGNEVIKDAVKVASDRDEWKFSGTTFRYQEKGGRADNCTITATSGIVWKISYDVENSVWYEWD